MMTGKFIVGIFEAKFQPILIAEILKVEFVDIPFSIQYDFYETSKKQVDLEWSILTGDRHQT